MKLHHLLWLSQQRMSVKQLILDPSAHLLCYQMYMATSNFSFSIACLTRPTLQAASLQTALHSTEESLINQHVHVYLVGDLENTSHSTLLFLPELCIVSVQNDAW